MSREVYRTPEEIRSLFDQLGVAYICRTQVGWQPLLKIPLTRSPYYLENRESFTGVNAQYGHQIALAETAPIYVRRIDNRVGYGVFADAPLETGAFIGEYAGVVQPESDLSGTALASDGYESDYSWYYLDEIDGAPSLEINGRLAGNEMRFVNHGEEPNLVVEHTLFEGQWIIFFVAGRDIEKDEQLLIDYGEAYWSEGLRDLRDI